MRTSTLDAVRLVRAEVPLAAASYISVRQPNLSDVPRLAALFAEMQRHYGQPVTEMAAQHAAALACQPARADSFDPRTLIAIGLSNEVCGSIVLNVTFPAAELSRSLYVRDLYVAASARRLGVARSLLRAAARLTLTEGFSALDWTMDDTNYSAQLMYENVGAQRVGRIYYRLTGEHLAHAAS